MTDRLANVKQMFFETAAAGFGARRYINMDRMRDDFKYLHNKALPALYAAIRADDPDYDPHAEYVDGKAPSEATGIGGVVWYVQIMEQLRAQMADLDKNSDTYHLLFQSSQQDGCFLDDLTAALDKDAPNWRSTDGR